MVIVWNLLSEYHRLEKRDTSMVSEKDFFFQKNPAIYHTEQADRLW